MNRAKLAVEAGTLPIPEIHIGRGLTHRRLAFGLGNGRAAETGVGKRLSLDQEWRLLRIALAIERQDFLSLLAVPLVEKRLQTSFIQIEVGQTERGVFEGGGDDHRHVRRFLRRDRIEWVMRQVASVHYRRKTRNPGLRFEQLLPGYFLNVGDAGLRNFELGQQLDRKSDV